jgi:hypothetical protein
LKKKKENLMGILIGNSGKGGLFRKTRRQNEIFRIYEEETTIRSEKTQQSIEDDNPKIESKVEHKEQGGERKDICPSISRIENENQERSNLAYAKKKKDRHQQDETDIARIHDRIGRVTLGKRHSYSRQSEE